MRVALLSTLESVAAAGGDPRGFMTVAGRSIVRHQLECALALGCEKIACHAAGLPRELVALQHLAEKAGAQFQVIPGARALSGMVRAADELMVFAEGLLPDPVLAKKLLADRPAVLALPAEEGVAAGFERIDREYAWAGLLMLRGSAVERLSELPPDADPIAGLLRIALQSGTRIVTMPPGILAGREWGLVQSEDGAAEFEQVWLARNVRSASFAAPFLALADRAATVLMRRSDERKFGGAAILGSAAGVGVIAGLAAWYWTPVAGMALMAPAYFLARTGAALRSIEGLAIGGLAIGGLGRSVPQSFGRISGWLGAALDIGLVVITGLASSRPDQLTAMLGAALLLLALRLGERLPLRNWKIVLGDRILLAAALAGAAHFGQLITISQIFAGFTLAAILLDLSKSKLTRT